MEFAVAKVSTKGQIVIPSSMREDIHKGDQFLIVKDEKRIILKNMDSLASDLKDDIIFAEQVENAWLDYERGKFVSKSKDEFLDELEKC